MRNQLLLSAIIVILFSAIAFSQNTFPASGATGIGTVSPNASSLLDVASTTQGVLLPRMTKNQRDAIVAPAQGLLIFQINSTPGLYYYTGSSWTAVSSKGANKNLSNLTDPTMINVNLYPFDDDTLHLGSIDNSWKNLYLESGLYLSDVKFLAFNQHNTLLGEDAGAVTTGDYNTMAGIQAGQSNTSGNNNCYYGFAAGQDNINGSENACFGHSAGNSNLVSDNSFFGNQAGQSNSSGSANTCIGRYAASSNASGHQNAALGTFSLLGMNGGSQNVGVGYATGNAFGFSFNFDQCSFVGANSYSNGSGFTNATALGNQTIISASNQVRVGNGSVGSIGGPVGWSNLSDGRIKRNISESVPGLAFISMLKPVTFQFDLDAMDHIIQPKGMQPIIYSESEWKSRQQKESTIYTGFIAQDVEAAANEIGYHFSGVDAPANEHDLYGLRYAEFVVPLVKAVQELDLKISELEDLKMENENLKNEVGGMRSEIAELKAIIIQPMNDGIMRVESSPFGGVEGALLGQNIPNPFDQSTIIPFRIPKDCNDASIVITESSTGRIVTAIPISCNETHLMIEAGKLSSGSYSYLLYIDGVLIATKQMVLMK